MTQSLLFAFSSWVDDKMQRPRGSNTVRAPAFFTVISGVDISDCSDFVFHAHTA